ncbi:NAD(P)H-dependent flavin oxidoreductase [Afifella marina]|uniref:Nitronate monooxygenase n=1 Tax=Afifella marina DSM 2698 TaxID=1120955 RepID=A0A1G5N2Y0_AFIMA|nr:nitronate monooxygenase [Afifella marina]MBK1622366.1 nitronate monooxygenase [Afifella marina DSM 2698]MBK1626920.1 nitronate monooxygenase [Afifella marina]MBK5919150.1 nitronate monooxygenase [Afifella marina]RAI21200.1 nitronate monooxygenase [Afifella marina DSM 2698]SCZ31702.1 nitronate monooxygenase [Afifella marina DSM 2698]
MHVTDHRLRDRLGLKWPIIQAPMAGVSTPAMAAAVSNAGGLGSLGIGATDTDTARTMIAETRAATRAPFNVNVFCHRPARADPARESAWLDRLRPEFSRFGAEPPQALREVYRSFAANPDLLAMLVEERPAVVSFHFGLPPAEFIAALKGAGIVLFASATSLPEAQSAVDAGIDVIVAQGYEAGGHRGIFDADGADECLPTSVLTRLLAERLDIPVVAAGGIMDGAGIRAVLDLGAAAAQLGTAFIACPESSADAAYRAALLSDKAHHTVMTRAISGRPARSMANGFTTLGESVAPGEIPDYPIAYDAGKALNAAAKKAGETGFGPHWAGQGAPLARALPVSDLMADFIRDLDG